MSSSPLPLQRIFAAVRLRVYPPRPIQGNPRPAGRAVTGAACVLLALAGPSAIADTNTLASVPDSAISVAVVVEEGSEVALMTGIADWFASFDQVIRSATETTDRLARRAFAGRIGVLTSSEDRRICDRADVVLASSASVASQHDEIPTLFSPSHPVIYVVARPNSRRSARIVPEMRETTSPPVARLDR